MATRAARSSWTSLVLGFLGLVAARLFGLSELFVLGAGMIVAPAVAQVLARRRLTPPVVGCVVVPRRPREGDRVRVELTFDAARRTPPVDVRQYVGGHVVAGTRVPALSTGEQRRLSLDVEAHERGPLEIGPTGFVYTDPLGLARRVLTSDVTLTLLVHPDRTPTVAASMRRADGRLIDALRRARVPSASDGDFRGVRSYQRGDDVRRVNWKASAKRDSLLVNEHEPDSDVVMQVIVDTAESRHRGDSFEVVARVAASLIDRSPAGDVRVMLCVDDANSRVEDPMVGLDLLATAEPNSGSSLVVPDSPDPTALLARVVITGRVDEDLRASLEATTPRHGAAVVVSCEPSEVVLPREWMSLVCPTLDEFARRWPDFVRPNGRGA